MLASKATIELHLEHLFAGVVTENHLFVTTRVKNLFIKIAKEEVRQAFVK
ncbi:hypothetical protein J4208_02780 [Candidatus Woesearchaeota archaeon]|nr:hypothetical protein [Candidatus Woesearchaeota archaeon]